MKSRTIRPSENSKPATRDEYLSAMASVAPFAEYMNGIMVLKSAAQGRHGKVLRWLVEAFYQDVVSQHQMQLFQAVCVDLGEYIFVPDVVLLSNSHRDRFDRANSRLQGPPDLVVEIVSHDSGSRDRILKFDRYFQHGVPWYWIVDPFEFTLEEWHATEAGYLRTAGADLGTIFACKACPGFTIAPSDIFPHD